MLKSLTVCVLAMCVLVGCDDELELAAPVEGDAVVARPAVERDAGSELAQGDAAVLEQPADAGTIAADASAVADAAALEHDAGAVVPDAGSLPVYERPRCETLIYRDSDGDGFGDPATALASCTLTLPSGYVTNGSDCYDGNARAYPGRPVGGSGEHRGDGSFDFDCDGVETALVTEVAQCPTFTPDDYRCPPANFDWEAGDYPNQQECYEVLRARWDGPREGWWLTAPKCGEVALFGVELDYTRETSWTCGAPRKTQLRMQTCR